MSGKRLSQSDRKTIKSIRRAIRTTSEGTYSLGNPGMGTYMLVEGQKELGAIKRAAKVGR